jgi:hypothetical protein
MRNWPENRLSCKGTKCKWIYFRKAAVIFFKALGNSGKSSESKKENNKTKLLRGWANFRCIEWKSDDVFSFTRLEKILAKMLVFIGELKPLAAANPMNGLAAKSNAVK